MTKKNGKEVQTWGESMNIPAVVTEEVKVYANLGWAVDNFGKAIALTDAHKQMLALFCHKTGLSVLAKEAYFLGNNIYVPKSGKVKKARKDENFPMAKILTRPATPEERSAYGTIYDDREADGHKYEHLWHAEVYAWIEGKMEMVANAFGHACVANIKLKGKENDPCRLCADMADTRAMSRALSKFYDFHGAESFEEVWLRPEGPTEPKVVVDVEATIANLDSVSRETYEGVTAGVVEKFMEENTQYLPADLFKTYSRERLDGYTPEAIKKVYKQLQLQVAESCDAEAGQQEGEAGEAGLPFGEPEKVS